MTGGAGPPSSSSAVSQATTFTAASPPLQTSSSTYGENQREQPEQRVHVVGQGTSSRNTSGDTGDGTSSRCEPTPVKFFWFFAGIGWLIFLTVVIWVTPGNDWLRQDGDNISWFKIAGGNDELSASCNSGIVSDDWCNDLDIFTVLQTVATVNISLAAVLLLLAVCRSNPQAVGIGSGIFFLLYAILQGAVVGLVYTMQDVPLDGTSTSTTSTMGPFTFPIDLELGSTLAVAFYAAVVAFNESLIISALASYSGKGLLYKWLSHNTQATAAIFDPREPAAAPVYPSQAIPLPDSGREESAA